MRKYWKKTLIIFAIIVASPFILGWWLNLVLSLAVPLSRILARLGGVI